MGKNLLTNLPEIQQRSYDVLRSLAPDPFVTQALLVASTDIFEGLATIEHATSSNRRVERAYSSLLRYLTRMSTRPTPFGLFSGVAIATLGECTTLQLGTPVVQSLRTRPGMEWLLSLIQQIEEDKALVPHLNVVANQAVYLAGARAILPYADIYGTGDYREITLRATPAVYFVMENARAPIAYSELKNDLLDTFPQAAEQQVEGLLQQLWEHHFLMSNLRPPLTSAEPEVCVLEQLRNNPALASFASRLEEVIELERTIDHTPIGQATASIYQMVERQKQLVPASGRSPFQIDMGLHLAQAQLNREVGEAVIDAIEALLRISPPLQGRHHLQEYLTAFQERYSLDAEVPLLDLLSPETGLDAPPTYTEPPRAHPLPGLPLPDMRARDSLLCSLLSEALYQHVQEIELTDELLERLSQWRSQEIPPPPTLEMFLQIHAKSKEAIDRGEWRGVVAPAGIAYGGRSFGRFF
ncbi:MAG: lantibiotic dehydratase family protein, partial [Ktedonobacteraceae bacterium]|nr:lantibiotic dehydratase family protein [Ktedonobacteraceae bacterium]